MKKHEILINHLIKMYNDKVELKKELENYEEIIIKLYEENKILKNHIIKLNERIHFLNKNNKLKQNIIEGWKK